MSTPQEDARLKLIVELSVRSKIRDIELKKERDAIWQRCAQRVASFDEGPLLWLTRHTRTEDTHWMYKGTEAVAPFPIKSYLPAVANYLLRDPAVFLPKSREMMTSWLACGLISWMTQWFPNIQWIIQTEKEDKVVGLIKYCSILYERQEEWMKLRNPVVAPYNTTCITRRNGSQIIGVPKGEHQIRLYHPHGVLFDEAAFLSEFNQAYGTARPVAKQIWAISSANAGPFGDECEELAA